MPKAESSLKFFTICQSNGMALQESQKQQLLEYVALLQDWNTRVNLISRSGNNDIWFDHVLHSITPLILFRIRANITVLDLGTGAGLPGIPLAILRHDLHVVLLDSIGKKVAAVSDILERLSLPNVETVHARAEELPALGYAHTFDLVLARAVARLADLAKWSAPLLKRSNHTSSPDANQSELPLPSLLAYKGGDLSFEVSAAQRKIPRALIFTKDIVFPGSEEIALEGKKLVIVTNL